MIAIYLILFLFLCLLLFVKEFYEQYSRRDMQIKCIHKLVALHVTCENFTEAGYTLKLHASLLDVRTHFLTGLLHLTYITFISCKKRITNPCSLQDVVYYNHFNIASIIFRFFHFLSVGGRRSDIFHDISQTIGMAKKRATVSGNHRVLRQGKGTKHFFKIEFDWGIFST